MTLQELLQADAAAVLADLGGEDALYLPAGGEFRPIKVVVDRQPEGTASDPRRELAPIVVSAKNAVAGGISGAEVTTNDALRLAKIKGGEQVVMRIVRVRDENPGWIELELM